jgi:abortive infection bacteriophage resistance protein
MGSHLVAVVQYTYTHKQYRKRHKTNNTKNTKIYRTTQKIDRATKPLRRVRAVPRICGHHPSICLTTEEKARENLSQGSHT